MVGRGMVVKVSFSSAVAEERFLRWVSRGNERCLLMGQASFFLSARLLSLGDRSYIFFWEHLWFFSWSWLLRVSFWFQTRRIRNDLKIERVKLLEFVDLVMKRGLKDE